MVGCEGAMYVVADTGTPVSETRRSRAGMDPLDRLHSTSSFVSVCVLIRAREIKKNEETAAPFLYG